MKPNILLINPPIYDFAAYDFWIKPYGLLRAAANLKPFSKLNLFDFLDRQSPFFDPEAKLKTDSYGRGAFPSIQIAKPPSISDIPRRYCRFGIKSEVFDRFLAEQSPFDFILIQTSMTYWYPGVQEVIQITRRRMPSAKIVLGGFYATCCPNHAAGLGADLVIESDNLNPLYEMLNHEPDSSHHLPCWDLYPVLHKGIMTLTEGCPYQCSYCYQPLSGKPFRIRPVDHCIADLELLRKLGARNIAFYDDALLINPEKVLIPILEYLIENPTGINFHTPNGLHARQISKQLAVMMVNAGFKTFYLGYESSSADFQKATGNKVASEELAIAVDCLKSAGMSGRNITAYEILGHPRSNLQQIEDSMHFAHRLGIRIMLSDFSPIPGTPDGQLCSQYTDLDEPLNHNKTAFPIRLLGYEKTNLFKDLCRKFNKNLES